MDIRIRESGLDVKWESDVKIYRTNENRFELSVGKNVLLVTLPAVIAIGYSLAFVILLLELFWYHLHKNH